MGTVSSERELINIIDSGTEAALLKPRWTVTNTYNIKSSLTIALSDNMIDKKKMNVVDSYCLYEDVDRKIIKFTI